MPTTYAHWRFGDRCLKTLDDDTQKIIQSNRSLFDYGVHGPDIFFYYDALKPNEVVRYGSALHYVPMKEVLAMFKNGFKKAANKEASLSYILGFLAHFTLDSYCHSYIEIREEIGEERGEWASHGKMESQLDYYFLKKDGFDPIVTSVTTSLHPSKSIAEIIAPLFDKWDEKTIYKSISDMKFYLDLLKDSSAVKRWLLKTAMKAAKKTGYIDLMLIGEEADLKDAMLRLEKYFNKAVEHYAILAKNAIDYLYDKAGLNEYFSNNFTVKEDYRSIPVLSYEDELNYSVDEFQK